MLLLHLLLSSQHVFFHLDFEQNLPTIYQSLKLICFGLVFLIFTFWYPVSARLKFFTIPLSLALAFLGFDELFQIHENIYKIFELIDWLHPSRIVTASMKMGYRSSLWILYYLPMILIFVFWCGYWLSYFQSKLRSNFTLMIISSLTLLTVLVAEVLSSTGQYTEYVYFWMVTVEEVSEMIFGSTLIVIGLKVFRHSNRT